MFISEEKWKELQDEISTESFLEMKGDIQKFLDNNEIEKTSEDVKKFTKCMNKIDKILEERKEREIFKNDHITSIEVIK